MTLIGGKKTEDQKQQEEVDEIFKKPKAPNSLDNPVRLLLTFVIIALIGLLILVIYLRTAFSAAEAAGQIPTISGQLSATLTLFSKGALQYNNSKSIAEFARFHYYIYNSANTTAAMTVYASNPVRKIYLLNLENYCTGCFVGSSLYVALNTTLKQYGLILNSSSFNYVDINQIDAIPKQSIIIIPSGLLPNILLPNVTYTNLCPKYSNSTITSLLSQGDIILYVGRNFTRTVSCSGQSVQTTPQVYSTLQSFLNTTPVVPGRSNATFNGNVLHMTNATFRFRFGTNYGYASAIDIGKNGSMIALSNFPSSGWNNNYTSLAQDIAKVLASRFWIPVLASGNATIPASKYISSNLTIFTTAMPIPSGAGITNIVNNSYPLVRIFTNNSNGFAQFDLPMSIKLKENGIIGMPSSIGLGTQTQLVGQIFNSSNQVSIAYAQIYNSNLTAVKSAIVHFGQIGPAAVYVSSSFSLPSGYYFANLTNQNQNTYSSALFYVSAANITGTNLNFKNGTFTFSILSNGAPVSGVPYKITLNGVPYNSTGYVNGGVLQYTLPKGTVVSYGNKQFTINLLNNSYVLQYNYANTGLKIPPFYIEVGIEIIIVLVIIKVLVPPNVEEYYVDVPDIRPIQKQVLKENSDALLDVFDKVNAYYRWKNMPLTVDEVKTGISNNIRYGNTKISVTGRNTYAVLTKLVSKGVIEEAGDYYALKKWAKDSNHSIEYLVIYRKLRDFCVANSMLFTELDSDTSMDMIITNKSTQNFIKIYDDGMKIGNIDVKQGARMFIAFLDEEKKQLFIDKLYSSYGRNAELLKMAINYGNIRLLDTDHIDDLKL